MSKPLEQTIREYEERLREAQLKSDVVALNELISDELQFVLFDGSVYTKQMDLDAHRSGALKLKSIEFSEQRICTFGDVAVVTTQAKLAGTSSGQAFETKMRYLRTWQKRESGWKIIAGSVIAIPPI